MAPVVFVEQSSVSSSIVGLDKADCSVVWALMKLTSVVWALMKLTVL